MSRILGIDPGSRITGYGIIEASSTGLSYIASGTIKTGEQALALKLKVIFLGIQTLIQEYQPELLSIEEVFMHQHAGAALKLGQARGAAIVAASVHTLPVFEYSNRQIKQSVVGYGNAVKHQVQQMICQLLRLDQAPSVDAADALAAAICHSHMQHGGLAAWAQRGYRRGRLKHNVARAKRAPADALDHHEK